ncbi:MAG: glycoside hydrolase family 36 protein [Acidimicrobiales bacterium]
MHLEPDRIELAGDVTGSAPFTRGAVAVGPVEVTVGEGDGSSRAALSWSLANRGDQPVSVRSVALVFTLVDAVAPLRIFRNGYQSWTPSGVAVFGIDRDPSLARGSIELARGVHHADQSVSRPDELRSEWVTVLQSAGSAPLLVGFDGGDRHDGTLRLREGASGPELWVEAFLGGAVIAPGEERPLHAVMVADGAADGADASMLLEHWAGEVGRVGRARVTAPYQVGWCSWYHYFHQVSEADLRSNLALAGDWPFDVFQLDDGFQSAIGDWLTTNERFPSDLDAIAAAIAGAGRRPGLWIAPFIAAPDSKVVADHPDWLTRDAHGEPLLGMYNPPWGGGLDGFMYALDTTNPEVLAHLESVAATLVEAGFTYLKLDFTFAPSFDGVYRDAAQTPAQRVRAGFDAIRRGAGEEAFLLGCGVPLAHVVGVVDGNRIGADVAPAWNAVNFETAVPGYERALPATVHSWQNTLSRSFMHRRLWLNDPDCLMLRQSETQMTPAAMRSWAHAVAVSGGMALVSDDLALLDDPARALLDEVIAIGRVADEQAIAGSPARCPDLMRHAVPRDLRAAGRLLDGDPARGTSVLRRDLSARR